MISLIDIALGVFIGRVLYDLFIFFMYLVTGPHNEDSQ